MVILKFEPTFNDKNPFPDYAKVSFLKSNKTKTARHNFNGPKSALMPHSAPETYRGPILQGWEPGMDRDVRRYLKPGQDTLRMGRRCGETIWKEEEEKLDLIVFVHSAPEHW